MDEHLRQAQRRWEATKDPLDLMAWDREALRAGYLGPIVADAMNQCLQIALSIANPDPIHSYGLGGHAVSFQEIRADWDTAPFPVFADGSPVSHDPCRLAALSAALLENPILWTDKWNRERDGYPLGYEFAAILGHLLHAIKHGLRYTSEELQALLTALQAYSKESVLCNARHRRRSGAQLPPCQQNILDCTTNDCFCYYGEITFNLCSACKRRRPECVCDQFSHIEIGSFGGGAVAITIHPEAEFCDCHGGGWAVSDFDSIHQCPHHYSGQPHPDDPGHDYPDDYPTPPSPPSAPPPAPWAEDEEDNLPF